MATVLERLELLIDSKLNAQGLEAAQAGVGQLTSKLAPADALLGKLGITGKITGDQLAALGVGAAAAGIAGVTALAAAGISKFEALAGEVLKFKQVSGTTADEASRFVAVMDDYKVSADQGALAIGRLGKNVTDTPEKLNALGVAVARTKDGSVDLEATFFNVVDAYNATNDAAQKAAIGTAAFGRGWQDMANLLAQGSGKLRDAFGSVTQGQILSDKDLKSAEQYRLAMDHLHDSVRDLETSLGKGLVPAIAQTVDGMAKGIETVDRWTKKIGGIGGIVGNVLHTVVPGFDGLAAAIGSSGNAADVAAPSIENLGNAAEEAANKAIGLRSALDSAVGATSDVEHAQNKLSKAQLGLAEAQERVNNGGKTNLELQNESTSSAGKRSDKERQVADALRSVDDAQRRVADSEESLTEAQSALAVSQQKIIDATNELAQAQHNLFMVERSLPDENASAADKSADAKRRQAQAELGLEEAQQKVADTAKALADTEAGGDPDAIAKAKRDQRRAALDLEQAQVDLKQATKDVTTALGNQTAVNLALKSESGDLEDATKKVDDAQRNLEGAQKDGQNAAKTLEQRNRDLQDALRGVEDAQRRVEDARNASDGAAASHNTVTKTAEQLAQDLKDAQLNVRDATKDVADKAGDQEVALKKLSDLLNGTSTPAAQLAAEKTGAIRQAIDELTKTLDPNSDAYKFLQGYAALLGQIDKLAGSPTVPSSASSSANAAEHALEQGAVVPIKINLNGQTIADVIAPLLRASSRSAG